MALPTSFNDSRSTLLSLREKKKMLPVLQKNKVELFCFSFCSLRRKRTDAPSAPKRLRLSYFVSVVFAGKTDAPSAPKRIRLSYFVKSPKKTDAPSAPKRMRLSYFVSVSSPSDL